MGPSESLRPSARSPMLMTPDPQKQPAGGQHPGDIEQHERRLDQRRVATGCAAAEAEQQKPLQRSCGAAGLGGIQRGGESGWGYVEIGEIAGDAPLGSGDDDGCGVDVLVACRVVAVVKPGDIADRAYR